MEIDLKTKLPPQVTTGYSMTQALRKRITAHAKAQGATASALVTAVMTAYLDSQEK